MAVNRYSWRPGARIAIDAQAAGREIESLERRVGRTVTPEDVLERARSHNSALHQHFTWDDSEAAHQHRLGQAGELIRSIVVDISRSNLSTRSVRAYVSVEQGGERGYSPIAHVMTDASLRAQMLASAWAELQAFRRKYAELTELSRIFEQIDQARPAA